MRPRLTSEGMLVRRSRGAGGARTVLTPGIEGRGMDRGEPVKREDGWKEGTGGYFISIEYRKVEKIEVVEKVDSSLGGKDRYSGR